MFFATTGTRGPVSYASKMGRQPGTWSIIVPTFFSVRVKFVRDRQVHAERIILQVACLPRCVLCL